MDPHIDSSSRNEPRSAGDALDEFRNHHEWSDLDRDAAFDRLIERFPVADLIEAVRDRLADLSGPDGEVLLRLVEANPGSDLPKALAEAVENQTELPIERLWGALDVLEGSGVLGDYPDLQELWDDLNESLDEDGSIEQLAEQIENDPDGIWMALQGLAAVELDVRHQIIAGLATATHGPGMIEFLRLLAYSDDPGTRKAAIESLVASESSPDLSIAWSDLAMRHSDPSVRMLAFDLVKSSPVPALMASRSTAIKEATPRIVRSMVTAVGGNGQATLAIASTRGGNRVTAVFVCDVLDGVVGVHGNVAEESSMAGSAFDSFLIGNTEDVVEDIHPLALALLAGCLTLSNPATSPALRYWVETTVGLDLKPVPFRAEFPNWDPSGIPFSEMPARSRAVLDRRPDWVDSSPLTLQIAEEIRLREGKLGPDPKRDAGAYRYLFEHRLADQLELYRRMLLWMAWFWRAGGEEEMGRSALALACQISDAQYVVPGHPFTVALTTRSLIAAARLGRLPAGSRP